MMLAELKHWLLMHLSSKYAINFELAAMFGALTKKVEDLSKGKGTIEQVEADVGQFILNRYPEGSYQKAVDILIDADAFAANDLGIRLAADHRAAAQKCANKLLESARHSMQYYGHGDHAHWAGKRIMFIHKWLSENRLLNGGLDDELRGYAQKLTWAHNLFDRNLDYWRYHRLHLLRD